MHSKATRITFDLTADEEALAYLVNLTRELGLELLSFVSFHEGDRRLAVAHVQGVAVSELIDRLWNSGHAVATLSGIRLDRPYPPDKLRPRTLRFLL